MYVVMTLSLFKWQSSVFEYRCLYMHCDHVFSDNSTLLGYYAASSGNYHYLLPNSPEERSSQLLHSRILNIILILPHQQ